VCSFKYICGDAHRHRLSASKTPDRDGGEQKDGYAQQNSRLSASKTSIGSTVFFTSLMLLSYVKGIILSTHHFSWVHLPLPDEKKHVKIINEWFAPSEVKRRKKKL
jgi:hypothetical protein